MKRTTRLAAIVLALSWQALAAEDFPKPYSPPCTERENVFEFTEKPAVKNLGNDKYEITFAVKGNCDVAAGIVDEKGVVVRHLGSGVLGANAPAPFQKNSLKQTLYWNGKDDLYLYHKTPEKLKVRVMLGLKPEFDKRLGGTSPKNLPGNIFGMAACEAGVFVLSNGGATRFYLRKFDHDGNYLMSLTPPPANLPEAKLEGMGFIEYEPGQRAIHCPGVDDTVSSCGNFLPGDAGQFSIGGNPVVVGDRIFYTTKTGGSGGFTFLLNNVNCDGSTSQKGCRKRNLQGAKYGTIAVLAASPDGRYLYSVEFLGVYGTTYAVWRAESAGDKPATLFLGGNEPGSAEGKFNGVVGVDCDAQGRLYVCDAMNNRVQVFSPEGKFLKQISADGPRVVAIHRKTGAIYLLHSPRVEGQTVGRLTKYRSFDDPTPVARMDTQSAIMAVDAWTAKPRIWLINRSDNRGVNASQACYGLSIWEEDGNSIKKISDFAEESKKADGANQIVWTGGILDKVVCDPVREQVYYRNSIRFDLKTGSLLGSVRLIGDDIAFDKRGYVHCHFQPGSSEPGVGRLDPSRPGSGPSVSYPECPYDYGVEGNGWIGILPCRDQPGAKSFQDGIGVNMMGDVAEQCNIYNAPKMDEEATAFAMGPHGFEEKRDYLRAIMDLKKRGEEMYFIRRQPGISLMGATAWTFDWNGELRQECAVNAGEIMAGTMIDEDGAVYFANSRPRMYGDRDFFLKGKAGTFGAGKPTGHPFTGTLIKTKPKTQCRILQANSPVQMDSLPERPPELMGVHFMEETYMDKRSWCWAEGAEWLYAGVSPIRPAGGCTCPTSRFHTDWYKRTFVPEAYRHSIGVLDVNGNLIMHLGRYGNFDSGDGPKSKIPVGGDNIAITFNRFISGTDNYLVFDDHGERLTVLKINYQAEETVGISNQ